MPYSIDCQDFNTIQLIHWTQQNWIGILWIKYLLK